MKGAYTHTLVYSPRTSVRRVYTLIRWNLYALHQVCPVFLNRFSPIFLLLPLRLLLYYFVLFSPLFHSVTFPS